MARTKAVKGKIAESGERLQEKYDDVESAILDKYEDLSERVIDMEQKFENKVKEHPMQSLGIALGVGLIAGALVVGLMKRR